MIKLGSFAGKNVLLEYAPLGQIAKLDLRAIEGRFSVLLLLDESLWSEAELRGAAEHLLLHGARYFTVHGREAERAHDLIDAERNKFDLPGRPVVVTVWIEEQVQQAVEFALLYAVLPDDLGVEISDLVVIRSSPTQPTDETLTSALQSIPT